jgi:hypothetical protein
MDVKLYRYEIVGKNAKVRHNGEDKKEGDTIELSLMQAKELPGILKALDPEGDLTAKRQAIGERPDFQMSRDHEKLDMLQQEEKRLSDELVTVRAQIAEVDERIKAKAPKPAVEKPAAPSTPSANAKG